MIANHGERLPYHFGPERPAGKIPDPEDVTRFVRKGHIHSHRKAFRSNAKNSSNAEGS